MQHVMIPAERAVWRADGMGKSTLYDSPRLMVGLNALEPGQAHAAHVHGDADKMYLVLEGEGLFSLGEIETPMRAGQLMIAPAGSPHGVMNVSDRRLLVLVAMAPSPASRRE